VTDEACVAMKGHRPVVPFDERVELVAANRFVDRTFPDHSDDKREAWAECRFNVIFKGSDWQGTDKGRRLEEHMAEIGVRVEYLPYTAHTSSTLLRETLERLATAL